MIDIKDLRHAVEQKLEGTRYFLVDAYSTPEGELNIEIDSREPIDVEYCAELSRNLHEEFGDTLDDYDLTVGSAGLTSPFKVKAQYEKNIGNDVEVLTLDGKKLQGELLELDDDGFTIGVEEKIKIEGQKKPVIQTTPVKIAFNNVKHTKYLLQF